MIGKVKWFNNSNGYGFIETESGTDVFVHKSAIEGITLEELSLNQGESVEFDVSTGPKGQQASRVRKLG